MNNDELQKAIDDITRDSVAPAPAESDAADNEALADEMAAAPVKGEGVTLQPTAEAPAAAPAPAPAPAPEPVVASEVNMPVAPAPVVPDTPAMPPAMPEAPVAPRPVVAEETVAAAEVVAPAPAEINGSVDLAGVEKEALKELYPLLDKVQMDPQEKFEICMKVAQDEKSAVSGALEAAKQIADEATKAEALLEIIEAVK